MDLLELPLDVGVLADEDVGAYDGDLLSDTVIRKVGVYANFRGKVLVCLYFKF